jgi:DNA ligase-4
MPQDNMGETVDVLVLGKTRIASLIFSEFFVIGGNYGSGKRAGGVSTLICGVLDDRRNTNDDEEPKSASLCLRMRDTQATIISDTAHSFA